MSKIQDVINQFESVLLKYNPNAYSTLSIGLPQKSVIDLLNENNLFDQQLVDLYTWKNGYVHNEYQVGKDDICAFGKLMPIEYSINIYKINTRENIWNKTFFPIIAEGGGLYILYNINKKNKEGGALYIYAPSLLLSDIPQGIYDSLEAFFLTQISCYENKKYIINNYNELDIYYDLLSQVSHRINSNSEYWKE